MIRKLNKWMKYYKNLFKLRYRVVLVIRILILEINLSYLHNNHQKKEEANQ